MTDAVDVVEECMLCRPEIADALFTRVRLWEDELWRLSAVLQGPIPGFAHLETRRHVPFITDLDGPEAAILGPVLARATTVLQEAAGAELTYVYVFGDRTPHLHFNLAPHRDGDGLRGGRACSTPMYQTPIPPYTRRWPTQLPKPWPTQLPKPWPTQPGSHGQSQLTSLLRRRRQGPVRRVVDPLEGTLLSTGQPVGFSTADKIRFGVQAHMHLHVVDPQRRGGGIGSSAVSQTAALYFRTLSLQRLFCEPNAFNVAPNRTLQRAGFRYVKTHRTVPGPLNYHQAATRWVLEQAPQPPTGPILR